MAVLGKLCLKVQLHCRPVYSLSIEWQISHDTENTEKSWKLGTKQKTPENSIFETQKQNSIQEKHCFENILK